MITVVRKSNIRAFLVFCADISSVQKPKERTPFIQTAIQKKIFIFKSENEDDAALVSDSEEMVRVCAEEAGHLVCVTSQLATLLTQSEAFWIVKKNGGVAYNTGIPDVKEVYPRLVQFYSSFAAGDKPTEHDEPVKECLCDKIGLVEAFFESLDGYITKRNIDYLQLPLRLCKWCNDPFFGNRYDQVFCSKIHGQRWRARGAYHVKKFVAMTDQQLKSIQRDDNGIVENIKTVPIDMRSYSEAVSGFVGILEEPRRSEFEKIWDRFQERHKEKVFHYTNDTERKEKVFLVTNYLQRLKSLAMKK